MIIVFCLNTIFGSMVRPKNLFKGVMVKQSPKILFALCVVLPTNTFMTIMLARVNTNARSVVVPSLKQQGNSPLVLLCPYCGHALVAKKRLKHFIVHKCVNMNCSYYKNNLKLLPKDLDPKEKYKYKLHYIYREFTLDFFSMDLNKLPSWATSFKFKKNNAHIMWLCLTYNVNLGLSPRKTAEAMREIHNINISHTMVANYARTASILIKPFIDAFD